jgi:transposase-like protein
MSTTDSPSTQPEPPRKRYAWFQRPRCPQCHSVRLRAYKTIHGAADTIYRYSQCQECQTKAIIVLE